MRFPVDDGPWLHVLGHQRPQILLAFEGPEVFQAQVGTDGGDVLANSFLDSSLTLIPPVTQAFVPGVAGHGQEPSVSLHCLNELLVQEIEVGASLTAAVWAGYPDLRVRRIQLLELPN